MNRSLFLLTGVSVIHASAVFALLGLYAQGAAAITLAEQHRVAGANGKKNDWYGNSVAVSGGLFAVGGYGVDLPASQNAGAVDVYDLATAQLVARFTQATPRAQSLLGQDIDMDAGLVLAGAVGDILNYTSGGAAYLFDTATGGQTEIRQQAHNDGYFRPAGGEAGDAFGADVAIDGDKFVVGAAGYHILENFTSIRTGAAFLFDSDTGAQLRVLRASDGSDDDLFGSAVAIDNGLVVVGAYENDEVHTDTGAAYVFDAATGAQLAKLLPDDGGFYDEFGKSVAIANGIAVVGSPLNSDTGYRAGAAYVFNARTGQQLAKLTAADAGANDHLGESVAISGGLIAVGAFQDGATGFWGGSTYLFDLATGQQVAKVTASDGAGVSTGGQFGRSVELDGDVLVSGAPYGDGDVADAGAAYVHRVGVAPGDYNGDGTVDALDYEVWRRDYGKANLAIKQVFFTADGNGDNVVDAADYAVWRNAVTPLAPASNSAPEPTAHLLLTALLAWKRTRRGR